MTNQLTLDALVWACARSTSSEGTRCDDFWLIHNPRGPLASTRPSRQPTDVHGQQHFIVTIPATPETALIKPGQRVHTVGTVTGVTSRTLSNHEQVLPIRVHADALTLASPKEWINRIQLTGSTTHDHQLHRHRQNGTVLAFNANADGLAFEVAISRNVLAAFVDTCPRDFEQHPPQQIFGALRTRLNHGTPALQIISPGLVLDRTTITANLAAPPVSGLSFS